MAGAFGVESHQNDRASQFWRDVLASSWNEGTKNDERITLMDAC